MDFEGEIDEKEQDCGARQTKDLDDMESTRTPDILVRAVETGTSTTLPSPANLHTRDLIEDP